MVAVLTSDQKETLRGKDVNAQPIIVEQTFRAPIERVWDAISNKDQMPKWFFNTINDFVPKVGFYTKFKEAALQEDRWPDGDDRRARPRERLLAEPFCAFRSDNAEAIWCEASHVPSIGS